MNQEMESRTVPREDEIDLTELFRALSRRRRLILGITAASAAVAVVVSLLLPVYYKAETRILPPQDKGSNLAAQLLGQAGGLIAMAGGAAGVKSQGELFVEMTKSRTVLDRMVDRFDLMKLYKGKYREDARKNLVGVLKVQEDRKSGIISLTVEDRDPKRAADMANAFVEELKSLAGGLAISEAGQRRMFFEDQIRQTKESLARAEEEIKGFQQRTGMFQVDAQARAIIEGIARLRAGIAVKEVEAKVLRSFATAQNPDLQRVEEEIRALRIELEKVETSKGQRFRPAHVLGAGPRDGDGIPPETEATEVQRNPFRTSVEAIRTGEAGRGERRGRHPGDRPGGPSGAEVQTEKGFDRHIGDGNNALSFRIYRIAS